jgi:dTDP-4-amino-4,6-dideoxygalactose transaminase
MRNLASPAKTTLRYIGVNGKLPEISAAMGLANLESLDEFMAVNRHNLEAYRRFLGGIPGFEAHGL